VRVRARAWVKRYVAICSPYGVTQQSWPRRALCLPFMPSGGRAGSVRALCSGTLNCVGISPLPSVLNTPATERAAWRRLTSGNGRRCRRQQHLALYQACLATMKMARRANLTGSVRLADSYRCDAFTCGPTRRRHGAQMAHDRAACSARAIRSYATLYTSHILHHLPCNLS